MDLLGLGYHIIYYVHSIAIMHYINYNTNISIYCKNFYDFNFILKILK